MAATASAAAATAAAKEEMPMCKKCKKKGRDFKKCGRCRSVYYCSRECQRADHEDHKKECFSTSEATEMVIDGAIAEARAVCLAQGVDCTTLVPATTTAMEDPLVALSIEFELAFDKASDCFHKQGLPGRALKLITRVIKRREKGPLKTFIELAKRGEAKAAWQSVALWSCEQIAAADLYRCYLFRVKCLLSIADEEEFGLDELLAMRTSWNIARTFAMGWGAKEEVVAKVATCVKYEQVNQSALVFTTGVAIHWSRLQQELERKLAGVERVVGGRLADGGGRGVSLGVREARAGETNMYGTNYTATNGGDFLVDFVRIVRADEEDSLATETKDVLINAATLQPLSPGHISTVLEMQEMLPLLMDAKSASREAAGILRKHGGPNVQEHCAKLSKKRDRTESMIRAVNQVIALYSNLVAEVAADAFLAEEEASASASSARSETQRARARRKKQRKKQRQREKREREREGERAGDSKPKAAAAQLKEG